MITNGVPGTAMMPFKTRFSEQEILELAKYVRHFDPKLKGASATAAKKKPAAHEEEAGDRRPAEPQPLAPHRALPCLRVGR